MPDRIIVYGVTGSGKSTLAAQLSERTGLPWHSVDDLMWLPGWVPVPDEEQRERITAVCAGERWILDAAYGKWRDLALERAELVVALDYPRWVSLSRLVRRTVLRAVTRDRVCNGNVESVRIALSRDSIIRWHFQSFARKRAQIREWATAHSGVTVVRLTSPGRAKRWLSALSAPDVGGLAHDQLR